MRPLLEFSGGKIQIFANKVTIDFIEEGGDPIRSNHMLIHDITEDEIVVSVGEDKPNPEIGSKITVYGGEGDKGYSFESSVVKVARWHDPEGLKVWLIKRPENVKKNQRRRSFRLDTNIPCCIAWNAADSNQLSLKAVASDLSFTGCRIIINLAKTAEFSVDSLLSGHNHALSLNPDNEFIRSDAIRALKRRNEARRDNKDYGPSEEEIAKETDELLRRFTDIPFAIRPITIKKRRLGTEVLLFIGLEFSESDAINRYVRYLERMMLQTLGVA